EDAHDRRRRGLDEGDNGLTAGSATRCAASSPGRDIGAALSRNRPGGDTRARRRILGPLDPADERDGHGCCHRDRLPPGFSGPLGRTDRRRRSAAPRPPFVASSLAVWALVGVAVYPLYRPHGTLVAGSLAIAAGIYELTPLKRYFRRHCREGMHSGFQFGLLCVGSSIGLMLM